MGQQRNHADVALTDRASMVHEVKLQRGGEIHVATYYIEHGLIHASVDGKTMIAPLGVVPATDTVRVLLASILLHRARRAGERRSWADVERKAPVH